MKLEDVKTDFGYVQYAATVATDLADTNPQISTHFGFRNLLEHCLLRGYSDYCRVHGLELKREPQA